MIESCPFCGSMRIVETLKGDTGICLNCESLLNDKSKQTLFNRITTDEETLAEKLVYCVFNAWGESHWKSIVIGEKKFPTLTKALAATVAKLKEVVK